MFVLLIQNVSMPIAAPDMAGYMPKRKEFETEWNNDAEMLIKDISIDDTDDEETRGIHIAQSITIDLCCSFVFTLASSF